MGIREKINQNPKQTAALTAAVVVLALVVIICQLLPGGGGAVSNKAFYTTDDGKNVFVDDATKVPPFLKDGKTAVRVQMFTCDGGKTRFPGYLEMYDPQSKAALEAMAKAAEAKQPPPPGVIGFTGQPMVKRPNDPPNMWVPLAPQTTMAYQMVVQVKCPGGQSQENLARVFPDE